ncbi:hypothetical protein BU24DRAFT_477398 [Aaosphaeria arxii CBS 175.79]|uniref:Uncharacterized protein n=1 Tax=Aaosphaeria arxii CBS 175.79 TaxID=1450172 RepID=A0A6A5Y628_9PLEO|nr:uncharacterized protein BU24DRAFT_477398 [Aaosphaeria arxii CBS 175.79]KAF2020240.1 hypothetical protein BU24DRAFT_477398 [Aaosphaeria arxii CBS 175.79]
MTSTQPPPDPGASTPNTMMASLLDVLEAFIAEAESLSPYPFSCSSSVYSSSPTISSSSSPEDHCEHEFNDPETTTTTTTSDSSGSSDSWPSDHSTLVEDRPSSRGTLIVDWDGHGTPVVSWRGRRDSWAAVEFEVEVDVEVAEVMEEDEGEGPELPSAAHSSPLPRRRTRMRRQKRFVLAVVGKVGGWLVGIGRGVFALCGGDEVRRKVRIRKMKAKGSSGDGVGDGEGERMRCRRCRSWDSRGLFESPPPLMREDGIEWVGDREAREEWEREGVGYGTF